MEKMTRKNYFEEIKEIVINAGREDLVEFVDKQIASVSRKSSVKTKTQIENEGLVEDLYNALVEAGKAVTITELQGMNEQFGALSNQKVSALMKKLVADERVVKVTDKKKSYFSVNAE